VAQTVETPGQTNGSPAQALEAGAADLLDKKRAANA